MSTAWEAGPPAVQFRSPVRPISSKRWCASITTGLACRSSTRSAVRATRAIPASCSACQGATIISNSRSTTTAAPSGADRRQPARLLHPDRAAIDRIAAQLAALGHHPVPPENPYWEGRGVTIADPDGWRIVLMNTDGI